MLYLLRDLVNCGVGCTTDDGAVGLNDDVVFSAVLSDLALLEIGVKLSTGIN